MFQSSCSELLVDTNIHDPQLAFEKFTRISKLRRWECSPTMTIELLVAMKASPDDSLKIGIYNADGNLATLEYGDNGYIHTGFRVDSGCNHSDRNTFPILDDVLQGVDGAELIACDGGSTGAFEDWKESHR